MKTKNVGDSKAGQAFEFISQNFAAVSAVVILVAYFCAAIFTFAYLLIFDWRLIWIVEFTDFLKTGLIALAFLSFFSCFIWAIAEDAYHWRKASPASLWRVIKILAVTVLLSGAFNVGTEWLYVQPRYALWAMLHVSWLSLFVTVFALLMSFRDISKYSGKEAIGDVFLVLGTIFCFGLTFALWVRDSDGFKQDVVVKGEELKGAGIVLATPHHWVFWVNELALIVPAADVVRVQSVKFEPRKKWFSEKNKPEAVQPPAANHE